jgi:hypothetical protein
MGNVNAFIGIDPADNQYKIMYVDYPSDRFSRSDIEMPDGSIHPDIQKQINYCNVCNGVNRVRDAVPVEQETITPTPASESAPAMSSSRDMQQAQPAAYYEQEGPPSFAAGFPKYVPVLADLAGKLVCTRIGRLTGNAILSIIADVASGNSADPGNRAAWRKLSDDFIDQIGLCNEEDIIALKGELANMFDYYQEDRNIAGALKHSMFKSVGEIAESGGIGIELERSTTKTSNTKLSFGKLGARSPIG